MADIKSPEERSRNMAKIRSTNTKPEEYVRKLLFEKGFRYRKNVRNIPGHPDAWFAGYKTALFVHGCFWHRHKQCKYAYTPKSRVDFWETKFRKNMERDQIVMNLLREQGVRVLIVWDCTVRKMMKSEETKERMIDRIIQFFKSYESFLEL